MRRVGREPTEVDLNRLNELGYLFQTAGVSFVLMGVIGLLLGLHFGAFRRNRFWGRVATPRRWILLLPLGATSLPWVLLAGLLPAVDETFTARKLLWPLGGALGAVIGSLWGWGIAQLLLSGTSYDSPSPKNPYADPAAPPPEEHHKPRGFWRRFRRRLGPGGPELPGPWPG